MEMFLLLKDSLFSCLLLSPGLTEMRRGLPGEERRSNSVLNNGKNVRPVLSGHARNRLQLLILHRRWFLCIRHEAVVAKLLDIKIRNWTDLYKTELCHVRGTWFPSYYIPKSKITRELSDFILIALTSLVLKILEKIVKDKLDPLQVASQQKATKWSAILSLHWTKMSWKWQKHDTELLEV